MTERKWTPGPWFAVQPENANGWWVVSTDVDGYDTIDESGDGGFEEQTAHLIAAAPDLYEALDAVIDGRYWSMSNNKLGAAKAALAKARGEK